MMGNFTGKIREFSEGYEKGRKVAFESIGYWYWIVEETEQAGMKPELVD